mgnify:CR=1 FL=1|jgi:hypothetical protein
MAIAQCLSRLIPALWLGALIGVSFLATPVKFQAPSLTLSVALDVGRATFHAFARLEWGFATLLVLVHFLLPHLGWRWILIGTVGILVALQALWLLPALDIRVAAVIDGHPLPPSFHHGLYAGMELSKALALAALSIHAALQSTSISRP